MMGGNIRDFENNLKHTQVLDPAAIASDTDCTSVDMLGYESVAFYVLVGAGTETLDGSNNYELEIEDSSDDSTFADAADADITNAVTGTNDGCFGVIDADAEDDAVYMTEYRGSSRYVQVVINVTGTVDTPIAVLAVQGCKQQLPVA